MLTDEELTDIQKGVNEVIQADLPITEEFISKEEAQTRYYLERLPEDAGENIRIIKAGDYEACPCVGPHVKTTKEIGSFRIVSSSFQDGVLRIRYKLGR